VNKSTITFLSIATAALITFLVITTKQPSGTHQPTITAIPSDAAIVIKTNGLMELYSFLASNNYWRNLPVNFFKKDIEILMTSADSLCNDNSNIKKVLFDSTVYISLHQNEDKSLGLLFYLPFGTGINNEIMGAKLYLFFTRKGYGFIRYNPISAKQITAHPGYQNSLFYFFQKGLLVLGNNFKNISESYQQMNNRRSLLTDTGFIKVYATTGKKVAGSVFINMTKISSVFESIIQSGCYDNFKKALCVKGWSALDIDIERSFISLHGFSEMSAANQIWLKTIKNEQPADGQLAKILPASTAFYGSFTLSDPYNFKLAYNSSCRTDTKQADKLKKLRQVYGSNIDEKLFNIMTGTAALVECHKRGEDYKVYFIVKTRGNFEALDYIKLLRKNKPGALNHRNISVAKNNDTIFQNITFQKLPCNNLPNVIFGDAMNSGNYLYVCNFKEYLLFGDSQESLGDYLSELIENKNITTDTSYQNIMTDLLSSKANITLYFSIPSVWNYLSSCFSQNGKEKAGDNLLNIKANSVLGIQVSGNGQFLYNNVFLYSETREYNGPEVAWTIDLDSTLEFAPIVLPGSSNDKNQYFVQDKKTNIYIISATGKIIWKQFLGEKILGLTCQIDYYKHNKQQIVFNTAEKLYLIDKKGKAVNGFPVKFKSSATNGVAVYAFDGNKNYRYYVALANKTFIALTKEGKKVEGWKFTKTSGTVYKMAQFFSIQNKDFILISDSANVYLLNRKGDLRLKLSNKLYQSVNNTFFIDEKPNYFRLVTTDTAGQINYVYPDGHIEKNSSGKYSTRHFFEYADIDGDGLKDYLIADGNAINAFNHEHKNILTAQLADSISQKPIVLKSKNDIIAIFVSLKPANKVVMLDKYGKIVKGFPINGNYPMNVISLADDNYSFAILTGIANKLYCYYVP